ncbi:MAG: hypothetical protein R2704_15405 [Microthrixaceae bacterium]
MAVVVVVALIVAAADVVEVADGVVVVGMLAPESRESTALV